MMKKKQKIMTIKTYPPARPEARPGLLSWQRSPYEGHLFSIMNSEGVTVTNNGLFKNNNHSPFFSSFFFQLLKKKQSCKAGLDNTSASLSDQASARKANAGPHFCRSPRSPHNGLLSFAIVGVLVKRHQEYLFI